MVNDCVEQFQLSWACIVQPGTDSQDLLPISSRASQLLQKISDTQSCWNSAWCVESLLCLHCTEGLSNQLLPFPHHFHSMTKEWGLIITGTVSIKTISIPSVAIMYQILSILSFLLAYFVLFYTVAQSMRFHRTRYPLLSNSSDMFVHTCFCLCGMFV